MVTYSLGSNNRHVTRTLRADFFANRKTPCQLDGELVSEMPIRISGIINEITGNVIIDLAGFWFFIDLAGKITNYVVR